jgi:hypothetical protein
MLTEVVVELEDEIGALADLGELLGGQGVNIRALAVVHVAEGRALAHLVVEPADVAVRVLREHGLVPERVREVLSVTLEDEPGALGRYCRQLADASINLEAVYLAGERKRRQGAGARRQRPPAGKGGSPPAGCRVIMR